MRVAILGTGAIGLGAAALLTEQGHRPVLWSPSGTGAAALAGGAPLEASGALTGRYTVAVAADARAAVTGAETVMLALPAYGHRAVLDAVLPHLAAGQTVLFSGHLSFAALYLAQRLAERDLHLPMVVWGTTVTTGRRTGPTGVRMNIRAKVDVAGLPAGEGGLALSQRCSATASSRATTSSPSR